MRIARLMTALAILAAAAAIAAATIAGLIYAEVIVTPLPEIGMVEWAEAAAGALACALVFLSLRKWRVRRAAKRIQRAADRVKADAGAAVADGAASASTSAARATAAVAVPKQAASVPVHVPMQTRDIEFLPSALEILVAPPSPVAMGLMASISVITVCALAWSYFG